MTQIKTSLEILSEVSMLEIDMLNSNKYAVLKDDAIEAIEAYHNQFKDKWIEITTKENLPQKEGSYFTMANTAGTPYYRIDIFTGRLTNAFNKDGICYFTHYQKINKPNPPQKI